LDWIDQIANSPATAALIDQLEAGGHVTAVGSAGSSTVHLLAALRRRLDRPMLLIVAHLDEVEEGVAQLEAAGINAVPFPAMEVLPGESAISLELLTDRMSLVSCLQEGQIPAVVVSPIQSLMQLVPAPDHLDELYRVLRPGAQVDPIELAHWLDAAGFQRVASIDGPGDFALRGGIIDIFPPGGTPVRVDLLDDRIESVCEVDLESMGSDRRLEQIELASAVEGAFAQEGRLQSIIELFPKQTIVVVADVLEVNEQGRGYIERVADGRGLSTGQEVLQAAARRCRSTLEVHRVGAVDNGVSLPVGPLPVFAENVHMALGELEALSPGHLVVVACQNDGEMQRMLELLEERQDDSAAKRIRVETRYVHRGFVWDSGPDTIALVPYHELLHRYQTRRNIRRIGTSRALDNFLELRPDDYVVHRDHGIGRFVGLKLMKTGQDKTSEEFVTLEFSGSAKLHVPAAKIELVQKYIGAFKGKPELSTLGGQRWKRAKERVSEAVRDLAVELLRIQAVRESTAGIRYPSDTVWQHEFEAEFPYEETEDQLSAIGAVKRNMTDPRPMDRLICGDVGFGKTEIAIRAAFKACEYGKQVAVLVPTTVLAEQHERTFRERFADYPFRIESLSRFKTKKQQGETMEAVARGHVDIVIGTHRLLSKDIGFADLGLVVIDEEQRFGVEHKQRLLGFRRTADVLTLSATPIPRTLHMAMLGIRDISALTTAPLDRRSIVTEVVMHDERRIKRAIDRELAREGQVYYVHNRVHDIQSVADGIQRLVPDARVVVGHGQMPARELETIMLRFVRREFDILVCTTIIESGIDIPTVNTMFIDNADRFGLSELHQLRGRVGRYKHRAYCYLLLPPDRTISAVAVKRLRALESYSSLGAGFKISLRDLEIRGAGNLLGSEQSGHIAAVGYEMYCQLLEQSVAELKNQATRPSIDTEVEIGIKGALPPGWIPSDIRRMDAYRRISRAQDPETLEGLRRDLQSAYGEIPRAADVLLVLAEIRVLASQLGISSITRHDDDLIFKTGRVDDLKLAMKGAKGSLRLVGTPDASGRAQVYYRPPVSYLQTDSILAVLRKRLSQADGARSTAAVPGS
jgi:transcription-repair coupling factor (superfamily II helicase)